jgi:hypothetical protein
LRRDRPRRGSDGNQSYVELPKNAFTNLTSAMIEGWVKWGTLKLGSTVFGFATGSRSVVVRSSGAEPDLLLLEVLEPDLVSRDVRLPGAISTNQWLHVAAVVLADAALLCISGVHVEGERRNGAAVSVERVTRNMLGRKDVQLHGTRSNFAGQMNEIRVWTVARTEEQIRESLSKPLAGTEPGLFGLWDFENGTARDRAGNHHGTLVGNAKVVSSDRVGGSAVHEPSVVTGSVRNEAGLPQARRASPFTPAGSGSGRRARVRMGCSRSC